MSQSSHDGDSPCIIRKALLHILFNLFVKVDPGLTNTGDAYSNMLRIQLLNTSTSSSWDNKDFKTRTQHVQSLRSFRY